MVRRSDRIKPVAIEHPVTGESLLLASAVSHVDEPTLGLTLRSLDLQTIPCHPRYVAARLHPMCASFNACLDFACDIGAELLFHADSDVVAEPTALHELLSVMDMERHYLSVGRGVDVLNGSFTSCGLWVFNMRVMARRFRFRDVFKQDLDLCERIETATGLERVYALNGCGYHHPIWNPREMFMKLRYSAPKYGPQKTIKYREFLNEELRWNPGNAVLRAGLMALDLNDSTPLVQGSKDPRLLEAEYEDVARRLRVTGTEYYVLHKKYAKLARDMYSSAAPIVPVEDRSETEEVA